MRDLATPKARAFGRALLKARESAGIPQYHLAAAVGISAPSLCKLESGKRALSPTAYGILAGLLLARFHPSSIEARDLQEAIRHFTDEPGTAPRWIASNTDERKLQHRAFHAELDEATSAITVWPTAPPPFVRVPGAGRIDVLVGEPATTGTTTAERLHSLSAQGARVRVLSNDLLHKHTLDCPFTVLVPNEHHKFVFIDTCLTGTFLHQREDVAPIVALATALRSAAPLL